MQKKMLKSLNFLSFLSFSFVSGGAKERDAWQAKRWLPLCSDSDCDREALPLWRRSARETKGTATQKERASESARGDARRERETTPAAIYFTSMSSEVADRPAGRVLRQRKSVNYNVQSMERAELSGAGNNTPTWLKSTVRHAEPRRTKRTNVFVLPRLRIITSLSGACFVRPNH